MFKEIKKFWYLYKKSISYVWKSSKLNVFIMMVVVPVQAIIPSAMIYMVNHLINELEYLEKEKLILFLMIWAGMFFLNNTLPSFNTMLQGKLTDYLTFKLNYDLMEKSKEIQTIDYFEDHDFYNDVQLLSSQSSWRPVNLLVFGTGVLYNSIMFLSMLVLFLSFHPLIAFLLGLAIIPQGIMMYRIQKDSFETLVSNSEESRKLEYYSQTVLSAETIKDVRLYNVYDLFLKKYIESFQIILKKTQKNRRRKFLVTLFFLCITVIICIGCFTYIIYRVKAGMIGIGSIMVFATSMIYAVNSMTRLVEESGLLLDTLFYMEKLFCFLDMKEKSISPNKLIKIKEEIKEIEFKNLSFAYPNSGGDVLKEVNFKVKAGEKIAIVGENGAGKTTLVKLLCGFYAQTRGDIFINKHSLSDLEKQTYRKNIAAIFQDFARFDLSMRENVALSKLEVIQKDAIIKKALIDSGLSEVEIQDIDRTLGKKFEDGRELSGGQWQKVALSRAFLSDAPILILDEPTSAMDARTEYELYMRFLDLTKKKTVFFVTHRLASVKQADKVLVLKNGEVHDFGSHEELMKRDSYYKELYTMQSSLYYEEAN